MAMIVAGNLAKGHSLHTDGYLLPTLAGGKSVGIEICFVCDLCNKKA